MSEPSATTYNVLEPKLASPAPSLPPALDLDPDPDPDPDGLHPHEEQYVSEAETSLLPPQPEPPACRDAETITDVCNSTDLPEFEIISLLEEQLPVYRLRADTVYGYDHDDWLHTPLVAPDTRIDLTTEQIEETLKYFLLCADRVGQMTKTYNDIDAVTRLLEELHSVTRRMNNWQGEKTPRGPRMSDGYQPRWKVKEWDGHVQRRSPQAGVQIEGASAFG
ncbi:uncharacterized protein [Notothenia coriiceps]|uniref:HAP1 N-terminal domain-containing protein n=1 Tax=Notothenia coriiceps TaxID=8208 RepID=A0A6I9PIU8_9TELE|nr:PREDICTED: uncharacterized protein LOC104963917 [Notothenia coriiceps]